MSAAVVGWGDAGLVLMRAEQQRELEQMYGRGDLVDVEANGHEEMLATVALSVDGEVAACGSLRDAAEHGAGHGEIKRMYVRPAFRGRGLSGLVLARLEELAVAAGLRRLVLETGLLQVPAVRLYRSAGYRRIPTYGPYVVDPMSVCYAKWLVPGEVTRVLAVNGSVGAGKTTVAEVVADLLRERGVPYAWIDVDALRRAYPTADDDPFGQAVALDHLEAMAGVLRRRGYRHVVLADVIERPADRELYERAFDGAELAVVRLDASEATRLARLAAREPDPWRAWHLARTVELAAILEGAGVDDAVVGNEGDRPLRDVAADVLAAAGWLPQA
ncbi:GNAT family N-acetyltransferase [Actinotalea fermentans]|uniref:GNAT family N-acetyltransferase n=1 Tax=Actinotalea fermentans TaxID=43671 RepID=UPI0011BE38F7|nr:GNAT family N-acetyltransferase [Actinotalea fermentans]